MTRIAATILAALIACTPARAERLEWHASPAENLEHIDTILIAGARNAIDMAAYVLSDWAIMDALKAAAQRGVAVRIILDGSQCTPKNSGGRILDLAREPNVAIRIRPSQSSDIMHLKAYSVDGKILRTGSANFSNSGLKRQDNDLLILDRAEIVSAFERTFETIWDRSKVEGLE